jgi:hypothetical protein
VREGIEWDDMVGLKLARRIDPKVNYLDAHYDAALLAYYTKLWLYYPDEMSALYLGKLDRAGVDSFRFLDKLAAKEEKEGREDLGTLSAWLRWPLGELDLGSQWLLAFAALAVLLALAGRWLGPSAAFLLAGLAATAALLLLEATAVLTEFRLRYHSLLLLCVLLAGLVPYQLGLDAAAWLVWGICRLGRWLLRRGIAVPKQVAATPQRAAA